MQPDSAVASERPLGHRVNRFSCCRAKSFWTDALLQTTVCAITTLLVAGFVPAPAEADDSRALTPHERTSANQRAHGRLRDAARRVVTDESERYEILLVERRPAAKGDPARLANVYVYDYREDVLTHRVEDIATGAVLHRKDMRGEQLPLTAAEIQRAEGILLSNRAARAVLTNEYRRLTGERLTRLDGVETKAIVFVPDASERGAARRCASMRCAEILMYTANDSTLLDIRPVVSLSRRTVVAIVRDRASR